MNNKKLIIIAGSFIGFIVVLLIVLWLVTLVKPVYYTYEEVESKMITAANTYHKNHPESVPTEDGRTIISYDTLVQYNYIKPLNKMLKDGDTCSAEISAIKNGNLLSYIPKLSCSDKYSTIELVNQILNTHEVVTEGSGLYSDGNGGYYFRGKVYDNYLALGTYSGSNKKNKISIIWQILGIDKDKNIRIKATYSLSKNYVYDNRYNEQNKRNSGYSDFELSLLKDRLKEIENSDANFTISEKAKLVKKKLCIGTRLETDETRDGSTECSVLTEDEYLFGLMYPYEYIRASLDENCKNMVSRSCQNYNLLANSESSDSWTLIPYPENNHQMYVFNGITYDITNCNNRKAMYLTANVNSFAIYKSGDGTIDNPYKIN